MSEIEPTDHTNRGHTNSAQPIRMTMTKSNTNNNQPGITIPRPSPTPRASPINKNPNNNLKTGQRLRAATSFYAPHSYPPPSCMAIRTTGMHHGNHNPNGNTSGGSISNVSMKPGKSLAAIAVPTGITIVDLMTPQLRPYLVLNYSSLSDVYSRTKDHAGSSSVGTGRTGGISTMAFQPCPSSLSSSTSLLPPRNGDDIDTESSRPNYHGGSQSSPILLATARGSGILIWDCSGRALSPLLGRLNASDSWSSSSSSASKHTSGSTDKQRNSADDTTSSMTIDNGGSNLLGSDEGSRTKPQTLLPTVSSSSALDSKNDASAAPSSSSAAAVATADAVKSMLFSPLSLERKSSHHNAVFASSSLVTSSGNTTNLPNTNGSNPSATTAGASIGGGSNKGNAAVTSLDWKGPQEPILLATCGNTACMWDLRTSLLSTAQPSSSNSSGARPNARFVSPENDGLYTTCAAAAAGKGGTTLIHCAYSHKQNSHSFATLDSMGVVRVWDDRNADRPVHSFLAFSGCGIGIASIAPGVVSTATGSNDVSPRWVTWGMDHDGEKHFSGDDDLVVKVWSAESSLTGISRSRAAATASNLTTVSTDADTAGTDGNDDSNGGHQASNSVSYHVTSRVSMAGAIAARVHPSFADGILLFRDNPSRSKVTNGQQQQQIASNPVSGFAESPDKMMRAGLKMRTTPEMAAGAHTPPSPPSLVSEEAGRHEEPGNEGESPMPPAHEGWEAELWRVDTTAAEDVVSDDEAGKRGINARKITSFRGGGIEEDALSFAPGRGDVSDVLAVDLALGSAPVIDINGNATLRNEELSLGVLTKASRLTVYGVPEASELAEQKTSTETVVSNKQGRAIVESNIAQHSVPSRVYRQGISDHSASSPWWNKNDEEELFGESFKKESPKKSLIENLRTDDPNKAAMAPKLFDMDLSPRMTENITEKSSVPLIIPDAVPAASMNAEVENRELDTSAAVDAQQNLPIDPATVPINVPCPPLCGVAFSGTGGLVMFNNGPVKRMWSYYQSNESLTPTGANSVFGKFSIEPQSATDDNEDASAPRDSDSADQRLQSSEKTLPRTLADLIDMSQSFALQQWGDNGQPGDDATSDDGGGSSSSDGSSSYDDDRELLGLDSDESGGISDSDDSEGFHVGSGDSPRIGFHKSGTEREGLANEVAFAGLPSLSPSVVITRKHDDILLSGQTPTLANALMLGDQWLLSPDFSVPNCTFWQNVEKDGKQHDIEFTRNFSEPNLASLSPFADKTLDRSSSFAPHLSKSFKHTSMMGNLKKLFANQLPSAMNPPDQRLISSKHKQQSVKMLQSKESPDHGSSYLGAFNHSHLGVYMLENPQTPEAATKRLAIAQKLCIHNAKVCSDFGQDSKANTWTLLAQSIANILTFEIDETDGWGGDSDALTSGIVEQLLCYYEAQGDFQMLCTIVCVLTFGRDRRRSGGVMIDDEDEGRYQLLPKFDERRYDNYIYNYAQLLYGWGLLTVRSEISKRLAYSIPGAGAETIIQLETNTSGDTCTLVPNNGVAPGVEFKALCGQCDQPVDNNYCYKCNAYAFQCSVCCSAVRGACVWCPLCGHGGHAGHIRKWFQKHTVCPTGCGCVCVVD